MLVLECFKKKRVAVFSADADGNITGFVGWASAWARSQRSAKIGFDFPDQFVFVREEVLTDEQRRLTESRRVG